MQKQSFDEVIKNKSMSLKQQYELRFWDIKRYLDYIDKVENKKKQIKNALPMYFDCLEDVIKFRCYNNEILNNIIENCNVDVERLKRKLNFINDYQKYLNNDYEIKECASWSIMFVDELARKHEEIKFLNELME